MSVVIFGPPAVGKSTVAEQLCEHFKLHHIHVKEVIDEAVDRMVCLLPRRFHIAALAALCRTPSNTNEQ